MPWQRIDDQFGVSQKVIRIPRRRRQQVVGLWTLAGNYAVRALTDGVLEQHELDELDARAADVAELVRVGLWHQRGHGCESCVEAPEGGVVIHDFLVYNQSREQVLTVREAERVRKAAYRDSKRRPNGTDDGTPVGSDATSECPVPVPSRPVPLTDMTNDSQSGHVGDVGRFGPDEKALRVLAKDAGIRNLSEVHAKLVATCGPMTQTGAIELARAITSRAKGQVIKVDAYVLAACWQSPDEVRWDYERLDLGATA